MIQKERLSRSQARVHKRNTLLKMGSSFPTLSMKKSQTHKARQNNSKFSDDDAIGSQRIKCGTIADTRPILKSEGGPHDIAEFKLLLHHIKFQFQIDIFVSV